MDSKSYPRISAIRFSESSTAQLSRHSDPIVYAVGGYTSDGRKKSSKRLSEQSLERGSKRSRTNQSPSEGSRQVLNTAGPVAAHSGPSVSTGETPKLTSKRKSTSVEKDERPAKRSRETPGPSERPQDQAVVEASTSGNTDPPHTSGETQKSTSVKRDRKTPGPSEGPHHQAFTEALTSGNTAPPHTRAAFKAKYRQGKQLGEGSFGSVFAGHRRDNKLPVAIKHISDKSCIDRTPMVLEGKHCEVPLEVALLLKLRPKAGETSAVVALLDWYDLDDELILVLERPVPCMDLDDYIESKGRPLPENEAKILARQLVNALLEVRSKGVFHNDIKPGNILIETGSDVPRVRLIDFGYGEFMNWGKYRTNQGTDLYSSPEWSQHGWYTAGSATVWQIGVTVYSILHADLPFMDMDEIVNKKPDIDPSLPIQCRKFLRSCLIKIPKGRISLDQLKYHAWFRP